MMKYGVRFGCRWGMPHDIVILHENKLQKWERCTICSKTFRWNKAYKGRTDNQEYLKVHVRSFAQKFGNTKRVYMKVYNPEELTIII